MVMVLSVVDWESQQSRRVRHGLLSALVPSLSPQALGRWASLGAHLTWQMAVWLLFTNEVALGRVDGQSTG